MKTVILEVRSAEDAMSHFLELWERGDEQHATRISFARPELLWQVLTEQRWELLKALCGKGPMAVAEAARRVGRSVRAVKSDIAALAHAGILEKTTDQEIVFPFDEIKVAFLLKAA